MCVNRSSNAALKRGIMKVVSHSCEAQLIVSSSIIKAGAPGVLVPGFATGDTRPSGVMHSICAPPFKGSGFSLRLLISFVIAAVRAQTSWTTRLPRTIAPNHPPTAHRERISDGTRLIAFTFRSLGWASRRNFLECPGGPGGLLGLPAGGRVSPWGRKVY